MRGLLDDEIGRQKREIRKRRVYCTAKYISKWLRPVYTRNG